MEKRAIIAALLMAGLLILYHMLFIHQPEAPSAPPKAEVPGMGKGAAPSLPAPPAPSTAAAAPVPCPPPTVPLKTPPILGPLFRAQVTGRGGGLAGRGLEVRVAKPMIGPALRGLR